MKFRTMWAIVEALTFDEFVAYGLAHSTNIIGGFAWSFDYKGNPITHENNDCYILPPMAGRSVRFERGDMLISDAFSDTGRLIVVKQDVFNSIYETVNLTPIQLLSPDKKE